MFDNLKHNFALKKIHKTNRKILDNKRCRYCKGPCPDVCEQLLLQNRQIEFQLSGAEWFDFSPPTPFRGDTKVCPQCFLEVMLDFDYCPQCGNSFLSSKIRPVPSDSLPFLDENPPPASEVSPAPKL